MFLNLDFLLKKRKKEEGKPAKLHVQPIFSLENFLAWNDKF